MFDRLCESIDHSKIRLILTPLWLKVGPFPPYCDKKDLTHAIRTTFGGLFRSKFLEESYHLCIQVDVRKPLRRGIFVSVDSKNKVWVAFKYENLSIFLFRLWKNGAWD